MNADLAAVLRIKHMAEAAAEAAKAERRMGLEQAQEVAAAYDRLQAQARELTRRAGWSVEEFDAEVPNLPDVPPPGTPYTGGGYHGDEEGHAILRGTRARVLLGQLAAWAAGYQETFELEARFDADARAKAEQPRRGPAGFSG